MSPDDPRHGTSRGYVLGCRDDCCRHAQMVYMKRWRMGATPKLIQPLGTIRRIQALACLGYSGRELGELVGKGVEWSRHLLMGEIITTTNAELVANLYSRLCMTPSSEPIAPRIRREARAKGYLPPLAWDDIDTDPEPVRVEAPDPRYDYDHAVIERFLAGDHSLPTSVPERVEIVRRWPGSQSELARVSGWNVTRYTDREDVA